MNSVFQRRSLCLRMPVLCTLAGVPNHGCHRQPALQRSLPHIPFLFFLSSTYPSPLPSPLTAFLLPFFPSRDYTHYTHQGPQGQQLISDLHASNAPLEAGANILGFHTGDTWNQSHCSTAVSSLCTPDESL